MLHKSLSVQVSMHVCRYSSSTGCYKRSVVIDGFLSLINSCGNRIVKAPLLMYRNRKPGRLNNLTLSFQLSREWNEAILSHCLVLGMVVSFSLVSGIQLAGVYTSILGGGVWPYLEKIWFKMGEDMVDLQKIAWFEWAYEDPFLNVSAGTEWSRTSSVHGWLMRCIKCLFKKMPNHNQK